MRILLIAHQLDYSGAPIALVELAGALIELGHGVHLVALNSGPVSREFSALGVEPYRSARHAIDLVIANTVLTVPEALELAPSPESVLAWIHETAYFFRILGVSARDFSLERLRYAAFPARFQLDEFAPWMPGAMRMQLRNCVRMPSDGLAAPVHDHYVCSGPWEARKNQVRLLELVRELPVEPPICFVGADLPAGMVPGMHRFPGTLPSHEAKRVIARSKGLISPSRAEAQPLAVIEAMIAARPVLLSDIAAHRELKQAVPDVILFDPDRSESFVRGFRALEAQAADDAVRFRLRRDAMRHFGPESFFDNIRQVLRRLESGPPARH